MGIKEKSDWQERRRRLGEGRELGTGEGAGDSWRRILSLKKKKKTNPPKQTRELAPAQTGKGNFSLPSFSAWSPGAGPRWRSRTGRGDAAPARPPASRKPSPRLAGTTGAPLEQLSSREDNSVRPQPAPELRGPGGGCWGRSEGRWKEKTQRRGNFD